ncbi:MAG: transposase [Peptococcaceae bacterium]|jgi:transposase|nr:transposase [Peptococcaceae bacterium]
MTVVFRHCAGVVAGKKEITVTVSHHPPEAREAETLTRTFGTSPAGSDTLRAWLLAERVDHVAVKATCAYWKPVFNKLEDTFTTWVVDPLLLKALPGRGDEPEPAWLAALLRQGLLTRNIVPQHVRRTLRQLLDYRQSLMEERDREVTRIRKLLAGAGRRPLIRQLAHLARLNRKIGALDKELTAQTSRLGTARTGW